MKLMLLLSAVALGMTALAQTPSPGHAVPKGWRTVVFRRACQYAAPAGWETQGMSTITPELLIFTDASETSDWESTKERLKKRHKSGKVLQETDTRIVLQATSAPDEGATVVVREFVPSGTPPFYCGLNILIRRTIDVPFQTPIAAQIAATLGPVYKP